MRSDLIDYLTLVAAIVVQVAWPTALTIVGLEFMAYLNRKLDVEFARANIERARR